MTQKLLSAADVARVLGVHRSRVAQLVRDRADFPRPAVVSETARGVGARFWRPRDIERWAATADRSPGQPRKGEEKAKR